MKLVHLDSLPQIGVSHNSDIKKKVFIENGDIKNLTTFATATFKPGQSVELHKHETMYEVFYILNGKVDFMVENEKLTLTTGDCITIEPNEIHNQSNPYDQDVKWLYFGIAIS
ncbi:hypothetical protein CL656_03265 [bacterium]|nr:hypothetical protein [bacterium]|tara:strand:- start:2652 stop:2990 length:339 start_codon:yes stop_codon:yes gene_type:complete